jgi:Ca2+-transporting ATPase
VLAGVLAVYLWALGQYPESEARGAAFLVLVLGNLVLALADASSARGPLFAPHRKIYWAIAALAGGVLALILTVPTLAEVFKVSAPHPSLLALAVGAAVISGGWFGIFRRVSALRRDRAAAT